uniref:Cytochrome c domain-containing protein n=1 Tax=Phenylobacterium glaciei TaxID=2803784 RepID=A0A974P5L4_9CAUL|nr:hypothetical protein JKL49_07660 [Phenylobacterium glaciei]
MRKSLVFAGVLAAGGLAMIAGKPMAQDATRSVWDGVYTEAQAQRGQAAYAQSCGLCHGWA